MKKKALTKKELREQVEDQSWEIANMLNAHHGRPDGTFERDHLKSIKGFIKQLSKERVVDDMDIALDKDLASVHDTFRYFCGVCWREIKGDQAEHGIY